jgi:hypothetical protein
MKPDREYRSADTVIGVLLGIFVGGVLGISMAMGEFGQFLMPPLLLIATSTVTGGVLCGSAAFLLGKRFTDAVESFIAAVREFFRDRP